MYINSVAIHRSRKNKENPHYQFLVSWEPSHARVKRESYSNEIAPEPKLSASKRAEIQAKEDSMVRIKKDIIKSLLTVSFVLIAEVVVYLARNQIKLP